MLVWEKQKAVILKEPSIDYHYLQAAFGDKAQRAIRDKRENERKAATQEKGDPNLIPLGVRKPAEVKPPEEPIPEVEWWDVGLLQNKLYEIVEEEVIGLREDKITIYVEHPVPLEPPVEEAQPPPMPLPLTQKVGFIILVFVCELRASHLSYHRALRFSLKKALDHRGMMDI